MCKTECMRERGRACDSVCVKETVFERECMCERDDEYDMYMRESV